jgi:hypothetical protein
MRQMAQIRRSKENERKPQITRMTQIRKESETKMMSIFEQTQFLAIYAIWL